MRFYGGNVPYDACIGPGGRVHRRGGAVVSRPGETVRSAILPCSRADDA